MKHIFAVLALLVTCLSTFAQPYFIRPVDLNMPRDVSPQAGDLMMLLRPSEYDPMRLVSVERMFASSPKTLSVRPGAPIDHAFSNIVSGMYVQFAPGDYTNHSGRHGADAAAIQDGCNLVNLSNVVIDLGGAKLWFTNYGNGITLQGCTNITIQNGTITCWTNDWANYNDLASAIDHKGYNYDTKIFNVFFDSVGDQAISDTHVPRDSYKWTIINCRGRNVGLTNAPWTAGVQDGAFISGAPTDCLIQGCVTEGIIANAAVEFDGGGGLTRKLGRSSIIGNRFGGLWKSGIMALGTQVSQVENLLIADNIFEFPYSIASAPPQDASGCFFSGIIEGVQILNNTFFQRTNEYTTGVTLNGGSWGITNVTISGNRISGGCYGVWGITANRGIRITDNVFANHFYHDIRIAGVDLEVSRNRFLGYTNGHVFDRYAILFEATADTRNVTIADNVLCDLAETPTIKSLVFAYGAGGGAGWHIWGNTATRYASGALLYSIPGTYPNVNISHVDTNGGWTFGFTNYVAPPPRGLSVLGDVLIGTNFNMHGTVNPFGVSGTNNGCLWLSNNTLWYRWTAGGTTTNIAKIAGP